MLTLPLLPLPDPLLLVEPLLDGELLLGPLDDGPLLLGPLDGGELLLGPLEDNADDEGAEDEPLLLPLDEPDDEPLLLPLDELLTFDELEQQSQQQQPAWWLKAQGPS
jgi:hypothetical protein